MKFPLLWLLALGLFGRIVWTSRLPLFIRLPWLVIGTGAWAVLVLALFWKK